MADEIHVALLDEGTDVWRPVPARKIAASTYEILAPDDYDPDDETWQFPPGSKVICEQRSTANGVVIAAIRLLETTRKTA